MIKQNIECVMAAREAEYKSSAIPQYLIESTVSILSCRAAASLGLCSQLPPQTIHVQASSYVLVP